MYSLELSILQVPKEILSTCYKYFFLFINKKEGEKKRRKIKEEEY